MRTGTPLEALSPSLVGPSAFVHGAESAVDVAREIVDWAKKVEEMQKVEEIRARVAAAAFFEGSLRCATETIHFIEPGWAAGLDPAAAATLSSGRIETSVTALLLPSGAFAATAPSVRAATFRAWGRLAAAWASALTAPGFDAGTADRRISLLLTPLKELDWSATDAEAAATHEPPAAWTPWPRAAAQCRSTGRRGR